MQPKPGAPDNPFVELGVNRYLIDLPRSEGVTGRIILDPSAEDTKDFVELPNANADEIFGTAAPPDTVPGCLVKLEDSQMICGSLLFDSAVAPGIRVRLPGGQRGEWPLDMALHFVAITGIENQRRRNRHDVNPGAFGRLRLL
jgi:hypothetical protein